MGRVVTGTPSKLTAEGAAVSPQTVSPAATVSAWVKGVVSAGCVYSDGSSGGASGTQGWGVLCGTSPNQAKLRLFIEDSAGAVKLDVTGTITAFEATVWHHILFTHDGSRNYRSYVDGAADLSGTYTSAGTYRTSEHTTFGALTRSGVGNFYQGTIAHVATWRRALTVGEVQGLAAGIYPTAFQPAHYWPMLGFFPEPDFGFGPYQRFGAIPTGTTESIDSSGRIKVFQPGNLLPPISQFLPMFYGSAAAVSSNIKTVEGVTYVTNVKTLEGLAHANIKTVLGIA